MNDKETFRLHFALLNVLILFSISIIFMFAFMPIPENDIPFGQPVIRTDNYVIDFNDEHISDIEQILFLAPGFFGMLRLYDALGIMGCVPTKILKKKRRERQGKK